jgi:hypothetical protein
MPQRDLVVIGASTGGLEAPTAIVERLPAGLRACILVAIHTRADGDGGLPAVLERVTALPVAYGRDGEKLTPGRIFVASPGSHLIVDDHRMRVVSGPRENGFRPAIDPLFRTAARAFGPQVASMPRSAIRDVDVDHVLRAAGIGPATRTALQIAPSTARPCSASRFLEEHAELKMRMARRASEGGLSTVSEGFAGSARDAHEQAQRIRSVLFGFGTEPAGTAAPVTRPPASAAARRTRRTPRRGAKSHGRRRR